MSNTELSSHRKLLRVKYNTKLPSNIELQYTSELQSNNDLLSNRKLLRDISNT